MYSNQYMFLTKASERSEDLYEFLLELIHFLEDFYNNWQLVQHVHVIGEDHVWIVIELN